MASSASPASSLFSSGRLNTSSNSQPSPSFSFSSCACKSRGGGGGRRRSSVLIRIRGGSAASIVGHGDYNSILGVTPGASQKDLKKAYHRLALKFHPDVCRDDRCTATFMQINTAYQRAMDESNEERSGLQKDYDCWDDWEEWMGISSTNLNNN